MVSQEGFLGGCDGFLFGDFGGGLGFLFLFFGDVCLYIYAVVILFNGHMASDI